MSRKIGWMWMYGGEAGKASRQHQAGIEKLVEWIQELQPALIVVEALFWAGLPVAVVNRARVRQFAHAAGLLA